VDRDAGQGPGLRNEQVGPGQQQAAAAETQVGVVFPREVEERGLLVTTNIQQTKVDGPAVHRPDHRRVVGHLFVLVQDPLGGEELEFGAIQSDALGLHAEGVDDFAGPADVGHHRQAGHRRNDLGSAGRPPLEAMAGGERAPLRPDDHFARVAVEQHLGAAGHQVADALDTADRGDAQSPGQDRGVRGRPAALGYKPHDVLGVQFNGHAGRQLFGHDDPVVAPLAALLRPAVQRRAHVAEHVEQPAADLHDVRGPLPEIIAVELPETILVPVEDPGDRRLRVEMVASDHAVHLRGEGLVRKDHPLGVKNSGLRSTDPIGHFFRQFAQPPDRQLGGSAQAGLLISNAVGGDPVHGQAVARVGLEEARSREGQSRADGQSDQTSFRINYRALHSPPPFCSKFSVPRRRVEVPVVGAGSL